MALMPSNIISETEDPTIIAAAQDLYVLSFANNQTGSKGFICQHRVRAL
jgi:hypothetical protein